jgi:hypothetical protein
MPTKWDSDPVPGEEPYSASLGLALIQRTSSPMSFAPVFGPVATPTSNEETPAMGVKSLSGS